MDELVFEGATAVERFVGEQPASPNYVEYRFATDASVGAHYPQAKLDTSREYFDDDGGSYRDRFPQSLHEPVVLKLKQGAKWTDVMSSELWSEGLLLSDRALAVFERFDLGHVKTYVAEVRRRKQVERYTYLFVLNHVAFDDLAFANCTFHLTNMLGDPQRVVEVKSAADLELKKKQAFDGELEGCKSFSRLGYGKLAFRRGRAPKPAVFGMGKLSVETYVRRELYEALREAEITGLEFRRNNALF